MITKQLGAKRYQRVTASLGLITFLTAMVLLNLATNAVSPHGDDFTTIENLALACYIISYVFIFMLDRQQRGIYRILLLEFIRAQKLDERQKANRNYVFRISWHQFLLLPCLPSVYTKVMKAC